MPRVVGPVGGEAPRATGHENVGDDLGEAGLHEATLVVLALGPRVREERPHLGNGARREETIERLGRVDLDEPHVRHAGVDGLRDRLRDTRTPHLERDEVRPRVLGSRVDDLIARAGTDLDDERRGASEHLLHVDVVAVDRFGRGLLARHVDDVLLGVVGERTVVTLGHAAAATGERAGPCERAFGRLALVTGRRHRTRDEAGLAHFLSFGFSSPWLSAAMKASCGTSTEPTIFMRFLPSFCFSSSLRLREMSPP